MFPPIKELTPTRERELESDPRFNELAKAIDVICDYVNGSPEQKAAEIMNLNLSWRQHRTLQQSFWRAMFHLIYLYGQTDKTDLRNEASKRACQEIASYMDRENLNYLPLV